MHGFDWVRSKPRPMFSMEFGVVPIIILMIIELAQALLLKSGGRGQHGPSRTAEFRPILLRKKVAGFHAERSE